MSFQLMSFQLMSFQAPRKFTPSACWSASCVGLGDRGAERAPRDFLV